MKPQSKGQTKKILGLILLLWILSNHCIRMFSGPSAIGTFNNPTGAFPRSAESTLANANGFRLSVGKRIQSAQNYCSAATAGFCSMSMEAFIMVLGLS